MPIICIILIVWPILISSILVINWFILFPIYLIWLLSMIRLLAMLILDIVRFYLLVRPSPILVMYYIRICLVLIIMFIFRHLSLIFIWLGRNRIISSIDWFITTILSLLISIWLLTILVWILTPLIIFWHALIVNITILWWTLHIISATDRG